MSLPDSFFQELRFKNDVEDVISQYVTLKKNGNTSKGLCPFHNEKTPSFTVYHDTQSFYCFGCGAGGDVITFVKRIENLDYIDAVKSLAERSGLSMPNEGYDDSLSKLKRRILEANRIAAKFYYEYMLSPQGKQGLDYFLNRGLSMNTIKHFGLGYAPDSWDSLYSYMKKNGFNDSELVSANLIKKSKSDKYFDNFRNRVMTPIINLRGNVIAFGGRVLDDSKPKYINTSDTLAYKKTHELFSLNFAKEAKTETLILCEGYMDVIAMHQAGFKNAVACCGTSLTVEQVKVISRYCKEVLLTYDADEAGQKAVKKAIRLFAETDLIVKVPKLSGGKDPDEILRKCGHDRFKGMLEGASNDTDYQFIKLKEKYDVSTNNGKIQFFNEAFLILSKLPPIERDLCISDLSKEMSIDRESIKTQLADFIEKNAKRNKTREFTTILKKNNILSEKFNTTLRSNVKLAKAQERIISIIMFNPDFYKLSEKIKPEMFDAVFFKKAFDIIRHQIEDDKGTDLTSLSPFFTSDELAYISFLQLSGTQLVNAKQEFVDCINTILHEYNKTDVKQANDMSDDDFRKLFIKE